MHLYSIFSLRQESNRCMPRVTQHNAVACSLSHVVMLRRCHVIRSEWHRADRVGGWRPCPTRLEKCLSLLFNALLPLVNISSGCEIRAVSKHGILTVAVLERRCYICLERNARWASWFWADLLVNCLPRQSKIRSSIENLPWLRPAAVYCLLSSSTIN